MDDICMTSETGRKLVTLFIGLMVLFLVLVGYVAYDSHVGRHDLIDSQRSGCERAKLDRKNNIVGWQTAQNARMQAAAKELGLSLNRVEPMLFADPKSDDIPDLVAARRYYRITIELEKTSKINCKEAFP